MNKFRVGQLVKVKSENELYKIEGYEKKIVVKRGVEMKEEVYILKHLQVDAVIFKTKDEIVSSNLHIIDYLLDLYNDYMMLYEMFEDEDYLKKAKKVINKLERETL